MDSHDQKCRTGNKSAKCETSGPIMEDYGEDLSSDEHQSAPVHTEDVRLTWKGQSEDAAASTETNLSPYRGDTSEQQLPPACQELITRVTDSNNLAALGQQLGQHGSDSDVTLQALSNVQNSVVANNFIVNKTTNKTVQAESSREHTALTTIIERTKRRLEKHRKETAYFETRAAKIAKDKLKSGWVLVEGPNKSGKTCLGLYLLSTFDENYIPLYVTKDAELQTILNVNGGNVGLKSKKGDTSKQKAFIIFIDEILKEANMHLSVRDLLEQVEDGVCHLILTMSSEVRKHKAHDDFDFILKKTKAVNLMAYQLQENERLEIFKCSRNSLRWLNQQSECMQEFLVEKIAKVADYPWYLQLLQDLPRKGSVDVVDFFSQPTSFLEGVFRSMFKHNMDKYIALVIIMNQGHMKDTTISRQSPHHEIFQALSDVYEAEMPSPKKVREAAADMIGQYVLLADKQYTFIHASISEPLCRVLFSENPDLGIDWCPLPFLISTTRTENSADEDPCKIKLSDEEEDLLKQRFLREPPRSLLDILQHPGFSDPCFHDSCIKSLPILENRYSDILMQAISLRQMPLVKEILSYLRTMSGKGCPIKLNALEKACKCGYDEAFFELINAGVEPNYACIEACQHGQNDEILSYLLKHFDKHSPLSSHEIMRIRSDIVAEVGHAGMIKTLIDQLQGREDRPQLLELMLKKTVLLGSVDKYHFLMGFCDKRLLNYKDLLLAAGRGGDENIMKDLLQSIEEQVTSFDEVYTIIKESFFEACTANKKAAADVLQTRYKELITLKENFITALQCSASVDFKENPVTLKWLLSNKGKWGNDLIDSSGSTALHTGCLVGNIESVKALYKAGFSASHQDANGNTPLHAHFMGKFINRPIVETLLGKNEKLERMLKTCEKNEAKENEMLKMLAIQNSDGDTPLHLLCRKLDPLHLPILHMMLQNKDITNIENNEGNMPLQELIDSNGCPEAVSALLDNGALPDMPGKQLKTIVHLACRKGNDSTIKEICLAAKKSKQLMDLLEFSDCQGRTPLHCYVSNPGTPEIVKSLSTKNTIATTDGDGLTPLDIAVTVPGNIEVVKELLKSGARVVNDNGATVLHHLCNSAHQESKEMASLLISKGAEVNAINGDMNTPLHIAAASSGPEGHSLVEILLNKKADIWMTDNDGLIPIHSCCLSSSPESNLILKVLLDHITKDQRLKDGLAAMDKYGDTPLHKVNISTGLYRNEVARMLIEAGADVSMLNNYGDSALDLSRRQESTDLTLLMVESVLVSACRDEKKLEHVEQIMTRQHCLLNSKDMLNRLLQTIVQTDGKYTRSVLDMLIIKGADVKCKTDDGGTVIHLAASTAGEYAEQIVAYLISKGTNVTERDYNGQTAIYKVCPGQTRYCKSLISFLHDKGVAVDDRDRMGNTPLHTLFETLKPNHQGCLEELLTLIDDPNICALNTRRRSPCDMAKDHGPVVLWAFFEAYCTEVETLRPRPLTALRTSLLEYEVNLNTQDEDGNTVLHRVCMTTVPNIYGNVRLLLDIGVEKTLCNKDNETACDIARDTGLDFNVIELLETLDTDGASISPQSPPSQRGLPCPEWLQRSPSNEGWEHDLRRGMRGIRNAAGMNFSDNEMDNFERQARLKLNTHFNRFL